MNVRSSKLNFGFLPVALSALALGVALFVSSFALSGNASAASRPLATGITTPDSAVGTQLGYNRIRSAGATMTRVILYWRYVAPENRPSNWNPTDPGDSHYNWSAYDQQIQMAHRAGVVPMVQVYLAPKWAERCRSSVPGTCNPNPVEMAKFAKAAAKRYSGNYNGLPRVRFWQPWNEPNLGGFFRPQIRNGRKVSPLLYRAMLNRFAAAVKSVDSSNLVVGGGLAPLKVSSSIGPLDFTRRVLCMTGRRNPVHQRGCNAKGRFDIWSTNPFTTGGPTHQSAGPDDVSLGDLPELRRLINRSRAAGRVTSNNRSIPLWVTEFSWDSKPTDPGGVPMGILTRWTSEAMFRAWKAGVTRFFWLSLRDWARPKGVPFNETIDAGLYFRGATIAKDRPKRNLQAFRFPFVSFPSRKGISIWGRTANSSSGWVTISIKRGKSWLRLGRVRANGNGIFRGLIRKPYARKMAKTKRGMVRAVYQGRSSRAFSLKPVRDFYQPPFGR
ncbi:MAG: hypothetical protein H6532_01175 [Thermoleophilales bacterium]|nr:hypothetical protein [Thermoleophilales bacterium]